MIINAEERRRSSMTSSLMEISYQSEKLGIVKNMLYISLVCNASLLVLFEGTQIFVIAQHKDWDSFLQGTILSTTSI